MPYISIWYKDEEEPLDCLPRLSANDTVHYNVQEILKRDHFGDVLCTRFGIPLMRHWAPLPFTTELFLEWLDPVTGEMLSAYVDPHLHLRQLPISNFAVLHVTLDAAAISEAVRAEVREDRALEEEEEEEEEEAEEEAKGGSPIAAGRRLLPLSGTHIFFDDD